MRSAPTRVTICHCNFCQRAPGSAFLVEPIFDAETFSVTDGTAKIYNHISEGSGKWVFIHFCETCGTKLFLRFERFDGIVGVYGGTFDDPNWFERTKGNSRHIFLGAAQKGVVIPAHVNTFVEHATASDGTQIDPIVFSEHHLI